MSKLSRASYDGSRKPTSIYGPYLGLSGQSSVMPISSSVESIT